MPHHYGPRESRSTHVCAAVFMNLCLVSPDAVDRRVFPMDTLKKPSIRGTAASGIRPYPRLVQTSGEIL